MIFHQLIFAIGAYLLARSLKCSREASLFAAIASGLMSYCFALTRNPTLPASAAWLPLALYLQRQIRPMKSRNQIFWRGGTALAISLIIGAGRPEVFAPCVAIVFFDGILRPIFNAWKNKTDLAWKYIAICFFTQVCGLALSAPTMIPALEWTALSSRSHGLTEYDIFSWSANWFDFLSIFFSYPMGDILGDMTLKGTIIGNLVMSKHFVIPFLTSAYVGPLIISFALFAFCNKRWSWRFVFLALLLFSAILAAGNFSPLAPMLVKTFPFLSVIRYPVKLLVFPVLILISAAAVGLDLALQKHVSLRHMIAVLIFWLIPAIFSAMFFIFPNFYLLGAYAMGDKVYAPIVREANQMLATSMLSGSLLGISVVGVTFFFQKEKIKARAFALSALIGLAFNLFLSSNAYPYFTNAGFYEKKSKLMNYLKDFLEQNALNGTEGRILPLYHEGLNVPRSKDSASRFQEHFFEYARSLGVYNTNMDFDIPQSAGYEASETERYSAFFTEAKELGSNYLDGSHRSSKDISDIPLSRFCKLTATQYVLTQECFLSDEIPLPNLDERFFELFGHSDKNNSRIYRVIRPQPRVFFADTITLVDSWKALRKKLCSLNPLPEDDKNVVYLLRGPQSELTAKAIESQPASDSRHIGIRQDDGQILRITTESDKDELLVISDQNYPGWQATLDAKPVSIGEANIFARTIFLPAGKHELSMRFAPPSVTIGFAVAAAAAISLIVFSLLL